MKGGELAISSDPRIKTIECAAYGSHLPVPLPNLDGYEDYEVVAERNTAYVETTQFGGAGGLDNGNNEEDVYEPIPE